MLSTLKGLDPCYYGPREGRNYEYYIEKLIEFLQNNKNNENLKTVSNLKMKRVWVNSIAQSIVYR
ncbi:hypothetical protein IHO40_04730 [Wolbachia endosymbiont of Mansonella ozzardi]|nr:hypothetical protein [Wolbachia endosymbiont of Mansonella ozzardi]